MTTEQAQALDEIRQIWTQYREEFPRRRGPWPKSIWQRVEQLWDSGFSTHEIASETGLPAQTMYSARKRLKKKRKAGFSQVPVVADATIRAPISDGHSLRRSDSGGVGHGQSTLTVVVGGDLRIEGLDLDQTVQLVRSLSR